MSGFYNLGYIGLYPTYNYKYNCLYQIQYIQFGQAHHQIILVLFF